jgi:hypothetical protein
MLYRSIYNEIVDCNNNLLLNKLNINYEYVDMILLIIYIDINEWIRITCREYIVVLSYDSLLYSTIVSLSIASVPNNESVYLSVYLLLL